MLAMKKTTASNTKKIIENAKNGFDHLAGFSCAAYLFQVSLQQMLSATQDAELRQEIIALDEELQALLSGKKGGAQTTDSQTPDREWLVTLSDTARQMRDLAQQAQLLTQEYEELYARRDEAYDLVHFLFFIEQNALHQNRKMKKSDDVRLPFSHDLDTLVFARFHAHLLRGVHLQCATENPPLKNNVAEKIGNRAALAIEAISDRFPRSQKSKDDFMLDVMHDLGHFSGFMLEMQNADKKLLPMRESMILRAMLVNLVAYDRKALEGSPLDLLQYTAKNGPYKALTFDKKGEDDDPKKTQQKEAVILKFRRKKR
jgi:hypothetical protein